MSASLPMSDSLDWVCGDAWFMDTKSFGGYVRLVGYIRRAGSAPTDDRNLATILGVTVGYLRKRAWPLIGHLFVQHGDSRLTHPRVQQMASAPRNVPPNLSEARSAAGRKGGLQRVANQATGQANSQANPQANSQANPSKIVANSTSVASDFASDLVEFATPESHAPSPSLASFASSQPTDESIESKEASERERARARAPEQATGQANSQANPQAGDTGAQATGQANLPVDPVSKRARPAEESTRIPADWQPEPADRLEALQRGLDPDETGAAFRDYYLGKSGPDGYSPDWSAKFRRWCRMEQRPSYQHNMTMALHDGRVVRSSGNGFDKLVLRDGWNGGYRGAGAIDGQADPPSNPVLDYLKSEAKKNAG